MASPDELERVAAAMNALRPDWPVRSLVTFLERHHAARPYRDLAIAAAAVATDTRTTTPNLLNEHGGWWAAAQAVTGTGGGGAIPRPNDPRCDEPGHEHELARNCRACRSEALARSDDQPAEHVATALTAEQAALNARGARAVIAALNVNRTSAREDTP